MGSICYRFFWMRAYIQNVFMRKYALQFFFNFLWIRLVAFILVFYPKFNMILEILVRWTTLSTVFSHCLESTSSRTFIMLRFLFEYPGLLNCQLSFDVMHYPADQN